MLDYSITAPSKEHLRCDKQDLYLFITAFFVWRIVIEGYFFFGTSENTFGTFALEDQVITVVYSFGPPKFGLIILR